MEGPFPTSGLQDRFASAKRSRLVLKSWNPVDRFVSCAHGGMVMLYFSCRPVEVPSRLVSMPCQMMFWADVNSLRRLRLEERGKYTSCEPAVLPQYSNMTLESWHLSISRFEHSKVMA